MDALGGPRKPAIRMHQIDILGALRNLVVIVYVMGDGYLLCLWLFAFVRSKQRYFLLLIVAGVGFVSISVLGGIIIFVQSGILPKLSDAQMMVLGWCFICLQPISMVLAIVGNTMVVRWITRRSEIKPAEMPFV